jgi:CheY-like chemotaxis protein
METTVLLVVDDDPIVARSVGRYLGRHFDAVHVVHDVVAAETFLARGDVTHIVCDHFLGEESERGLDVLPRWRICFPGIGVAVLLSGSELMRLVMPDGIDAFVPKPPDPHELCRALKLRLD